MSKVKDLIKKRSEESPAFKREYERLKEETKLELNLMPKTANKIKARHFQGRDRLSEKEYIWHIPRRLRGGIEVGDVVWADALGKTVPVKVTEIFREEFVPGVNDCKMVRRVKLP